MEKTKYYRTAEIDFTINIEQPEHGKVKIPVYANIPAHSLLKSLTVTLSENDFDSDMEILVPASFGDDWGEACFNQLQVRVVKHIQDYGRILPADLECFIAEMVLVISSIGEAIQQPLSFDMRKDVFKRVLVDISDELNIPIEIPL